MKFSSVTVDVPVLRGIYERPVPVFKTDEPLFAGGDTVHYGKIVGWKSTRYGPFVRYDCDIEERNTAGHYNVALRDIFPPIVDVQVYYWEPLENRKLMGRYIRQPGNFGLPISRARQYFRQYNVEWRLLLNDHDAQNGLVSWTPHPKGRPTCWAIDGKCNNLMANIVYEQGVDIPLCAKHLAQHNEKRRIMRQA